MRIRTIATVIAAIGLSALGLTAASAAPAAPAALAAPPPATTAGLAVWIGIGAGQHAAGSTYYPLEFTNISGHTVTIRGYPGVSAVGAGRQLGSSAAWAHATPVTVTLRNGATAHTLLQIVNAYNFGGKVAMATELKIYPPNTRTATYIDFTFPALVKKGTTFMLLTEPIVPGVGIPGQGP